MTISEVSKKYNITADTLRYYERIGLIPPVPRTKSGLRDYDETSCNWVNFATVYKGNIIKNLIMDCQSYTKYRPNETTGGIFVSWRRKEELPTGA